MMDAYSLFWIAVGSVATALIVFINLYLIFIKPWCEHPKLTIEFTMNEPFVRRATSEILDKQNITDKDVTSTNWIRIKIKNSGRLVAKSCIGKLIEIWNEDEKKILDQFDPTQLHWVTTGWKESPFSVLNLNYQEYAYLDLLATQSDEFIYICGNQFPWAQVPSGKYERMATRNCLKPGRYIMTVTVHGDNVNPKTSYLSLKWGGQNFKDVSVEIHKTFDKAKECLNRESK